MIVDTLVRTVSSHKLKVLWGARRDDSQPTEFQQLNGHRTGRRGTAIYKHFKRFSALLLSCVEQLAGQAEREEKRERRRCDS